MFISAVICKAIATDRMALSNAGQSFSTDTHTDITNGIYAEGESCT